VQEGAHVGGDAVAAAGCLALFLGVGGGGDDEAGKAQVTDWVAGWGLVGVGGWSLKGAIGLV